MHGISTRKYETQQKKMKRMTGIRCNMSVSMGNPPFTIESSGLTNVPGSGGCRLQRCLSSYSYLESHWKMSSVPIKSKVSVVEH